MNLLAIILNGAYVLYFAALLFRDILWLRVFAFASSIALVLWSYMTETWVLLHWHVVFAVINTFQVVRLIQERRPVVLADDREAIYQNAFAHMSRREFDRLWKLGKIRSVENQHITRLGVHPEEVYFIVEGEVGVHNDYKEIALLTKHKFVGEMSYLSGNPASADTFAIGPVQLLVWPRRLLGDSRKMDADLLGKLHIALGQDLSEKLADES